MKGVGERSAAVSRRLTSPISKPAEGVNYFSFVAAPEYETITIEGITEWGMDLWIRIQEPV